MESGFCKRMRVEGGASRGVEIRQDTAQAVDIAQNPPNTSQANEMSIEVVSRAEGVENPVTKQTESMPDGAAASEKLRLHGSTPSQPVTLASAIMNSAPAGTSPQSPHARRHKKLQRLLQKMVDQRRGHAEPLATLASTARDLLCDDETDSGSALSLLLDYCQSPELLTFAQAEGLVAPSFSVNPHAKEGNQVHDRFFRALRDSLANDDQQEDFEVEIVFHGTRECNIDNILEHGLDPNLRRNQAYGPGEYFSRRPQDSISYCHNGTAMLVFCVVVPPECKPFGLKPLPQNPQTFPPVTFPLPPVPVPAPPPPAPAPTVLQPNTQKPGASLSWALPNWSSGPTSQPQAAAPTPPALAPSAGTSALQFFRSLFAPSSPQPQQPNAQSNAQAPPASAMTQLTNVGASTSVSAPQAAPLPAQQAPAAQPAAPQPSVPSSSFNSAFPQAHSYRGGRATPPSYVVVPTQSHQIPLGVLRFAGASSEAVQRSRCLRSQLRALSQELAQKDKEAEEVNIKAEIIQLLIKKFIDTAGSRYEKAKKNKQLSQLALKEISMFAHHLFDADIVSFYLPDLPEPLSIQEHADTQILSVEASEAAASQARKDYDQALAKMQSGNF